MLDLAGHLAKVAIQGSITLKPKSMGDGVRWSSLQRVAAFLVWLVCGAISADAQSLGSTSEEALQRASIDFSTALANWGDGTSEANEALLEEALVLRKLWLGPDDPAIADVLERLGALHYNRKLYARAEDEFRQALDIYTRTAGEGAQGTLRALGDLGAALREQGRYADAEPIVKRSVALRRKFLPADDPAIASGLNNLGRLYMAMGRVHDARKALEESLAIATARQDIDGLVRDDTALLSGLNAVDAKIREIMLRAFEVALVMMVFAAITIGTFLATERCYAARPPSRPPAYIMPIVLISRMAANLAAFFAGAMAGGVVVHYISDGQMDFRIGYAVGGLAALLSIELLVPYMINLARPFAGLQREDFRIEPERIWPEKAPGRRSAKPWFPAVELAYPRIGTQYKIFVTPHALCGARIDPLWSMLLGARTSLPFNAIEWMQSEQVRAYDAIAPESEAFRRLDPANFQIAWKDIASLAYSTGRKVFGLMQAKTGILTVVLHSGETREWRLLGQQNGTALQSELERYRAAAVVDNIIPAGQLTTGEA